MVESIRTRRAFSALSRSRNRGRSGPIWIVRAGPDTPGLGTAGPDSPGPDTGESGTDAVRVAYAVGRAVGGAVTRNRIRRRLRAIVAELDLPPGAYLVGVSPAVATESFASLRAHVATALDRLDPVTAPS